MNYLKAFMTILFFHLLGLHNSSAQPISTQYGMVVSEHYLASKVGLDILRAGGNAIDAAVAVGYALAVVNPCCGNIGGGGFMTIHLANGKDISLNFREKAPLNANKNMFLDKDGHLIPGKTMKGYLSVATPGTVLGLDTALCKYGTLSRKKVMAPAIQLAKQGFVVSAYDQKLFNIEFNILRHQPNVAAIFLKNGKPYQPGERIVQNDLSHTLEQIAEYGPNVFYHGYIAKTIVNASQQHGGILTLADFENYSIEELNPIRCNYRGYTVVSSPPPSSGGIILCEMLNILENDPIKKFDYRSPERTHLIIEAMRFGFHDRNSKFGDPHFVKIPIKKLISKKYANDINQKIIYASYSESENPFQHESTQTTHYSVLDHLGNAVSVTYTLDALFGAKVIAGNTGFFLNNQMDDFTAKLNNPNRFGLVQSEKNDIQPGKQPLSSMTPTIILKDGKIVLVLGSPGGSRIITSVLQTILNVIDGKMSIKDAVNMPRFHYQNIPNVIDVEPNAISFLASKQLELNHNYHFVNLAPWGAVESIYINPIDGTVSGGYDERRPNGAALGE